MFRSSPSSPNAPTDIPPHRYGGCHHMPGILSATIDPCWLDKRRWTPGPVHGNQQYLAHTGAAVWTPLVKMNNVTYKQSKATDAFQTKSFFFFNFEFLHFQGNREIKGPPEFGFGEGDCGADGQNLVFVSFTVVHPAFWGVFRINIYP